MTSLLPLPFFKSLWKIYLISVTRLLMLSKEWHPFFFPSNGINFGRNFMYLFSFFLFYLCYFIFPWQIQKLCDRVASSTLLDDRRNAVRALKSLSKVCNTVSAIKVIKLDIPFVNNIFLLCRNTAWKWVFKQWNILSMFYKQIGMSLFNDFSP